MHPVVHYALEKQKKMVVFYGSTIFFTAGLVYVGFKPEILPAYQTFCASISALAIGFFTAHAAQRNSEVKHQGVAQEKEEVKSDANNPK